MPLTLQDWESIAVIATCIGGLAVWLWRSRFPTALATVVTNVDRVLHEVTPNGGSSLKDRVMKLEQSHHTLHESQQKQTDALHRIEEKVSHLSGGDGKNNAPSF